MRIAYIVMSHTLPEQLVRLVDRLDGEHAHFLIHIDRRVPTAVFADAIEKLRANPRVLFLKRQSCARSGFGAVAVPLDGIRELVERQLVFDYVLRLSGQDYPIKSNEEIIGFLAPRRESSFLYTHPFDLRSWRAWPRRYRHWHVRLRGRHFALPVHRDMPNGLEPFGGEACWCLTRTCALYVHEFAQREPRVVRFFKHVDKPDEMFFHTVLLNSPLEHGIVRDDVTYTDWSRGRSRPEILTTADFDRLRAADELFARKFDPRVDSEILDRIDAHLLRLPGRSAGEGPLLAD